MTVHTVTREQFNEWAAANRNNPESDASDDAGLLDWDETDDDAFAQMTTYLVGIQNVNDERGIVIADDFVTFTIPALDSARLVYDLVMDDYNNADDRSTDLPDSPWVIYQLSGDEAVDECGSHPIIAIDLLMELMKSLGVE